MPSKLTLEVLDFLSVTFIIIVHLSLAVVVQLIDDNKLRVLSLYSEVSIGEAQDSLRSCMVFNNYMVYSAST